MANNWVIEYKPVYIVIGSVILSEFLYYILSLLFNIDFYLEGVILCFFIPMFVSYPMSFIMYRYQSKIKEQRDELQKIDTLNKRIFSLISHDIRTPITNASQIISLLESGFIDPQENKQLLREVNESYTQVMVFFDDLLYWSKKQLSKKPFESEYFEGDDVIKRYLDIFKPQIAGKNLIINYNASSVTLFADRGSYEFVIRNVLQNAIKYTPVNGDINIEISVNNGTIDTIIQDNGVGISQERLDEIRNNHEFVSSNKKNGTISTGFGLKTCIDYINRQNGSLEIDSEPDKGTSVIISLPKPLKSE